MTQRRQAEDLSQSSAARQEPGTCARTCAWDGCNAEGIYRAPIDRNLSEYQYFCLEHVRLYNASWNFHAGLTSDEIEVEIRSAATWDRPTWKMGSAGPHPLHIHENVKDPFGMGQGTAFDGSARAKTYRARPRGGKTSAENAALRIFDLTAPLSLESLRGRYKILVKRHHPDANGGSQDAEQRMKIINEAYRTLRAGLTAEPR